jgi:hypothetical protein
MQDLKIDGISEVPGKFGNKVTIISGKNKYNFYSTKKDGSQTKAYGQYKLYRYQFGDTVKCEVAEEAKSFVNAEGKTVNFTDRRIMYFAEVEGAPDFDRPKTAPVVPTINIDAEITEDQLPF